jgi:hypothetical protein
MAVLAFPVIPHGEPTCESHDFQLTLISNHLQADVAESTIHLGQALPLELSKHGGKKTYAKARKGSSTLVGSHNLSVWHAQGQHVRINPFYDG